VAARLTHLRAVHSTARDEPARRYGSAVYANNATNEKNIISQALPAAPAEADVTAYLGRTVNCNQPERYGLTLRAKL